MNFILRPFYDSDVEALTKYANNISIARFLTDRFPHPYTSAHAQEFIRMANAKNPAEIFAIVINNESAGAIGLHPQTDIHRRNAEMGYWLAEPYWGNGIIPRAIREVVEYGFRTFDIDRIFARPFSSNPKSHRVLEKAGFTLEARFEKTLVKNGEIIDELIYSIRRY